MGCFVSTPSIGQSNLDSISTKREMDRVMHAIPIVRSPTEIGSFFCVENESKEHKLTQQQDGLETGTSFVYLPRANILYDSNNANLCNREVAGLMATPGNQNPDKGKFVYFVQ